MPIYTSLTEDASLQNLKRLFWLRSIVIAGEIMAIVVALQFLQITLPLWPIASTILVYAAVNAFTWFRVKRGKRVSALEFSLQLALDTLLFAILLYFVGGYTNPFVSLFLLPLVISAAILPKVYTWAMATLTIACYTLLMFRYIPLPHIHMSHGSDNFDLHVLGMWFSFLLSASIVVFFVVKMASTLKERDEALARAREKALQDENLVALGTLATGAAHELGTPLATMAVLANEFKHDYANEPELVERAEIFRSQVDRCKAIISNISASTGQAIAEGGGRHQIDAYLRETVAQWRALRPNVQLTYIDCDYSPVPQIVVDKTLTQALINLFNNAADASIDHVEINACWDSERLVLDICDHGKGIDSGVQAMMGTPFFTTKEDGHGLGLYLAKAVLERFNASLELNNRSQGGTQVRVVLPLIPLDSGHESM